MLFQAILVFADVLAVFGGVMPPKHDTGMMPDIGPSVPDTGAGIGGPTGQGIGGPGDFSVNVHPSIDFPSQVDPSVGGDIPFVGSVDTNIRTRIADTIRQIDSGSTGSSDIALDINPTGPKAGTPIALREYEEIVDNFACSTCDAASLCQRSHSTECYKYISCIKPTARTLEYTAVARLCPFGTFFNESKQVCVAPGDANCKYDKCRDINIRSYQHPDGACGSYWECEGSPAGRISKAACCGQGQSFNSKTGMCQSDSSCTDPCPDPRTASCNGVSKPIPGSPNCRAYWTCQDGLHVGSCCPFGTRYVYSADQQQCVHDPLCQSDCPDGFDVTKDPCKTNFNSFPAFPMDDYLCRSYFRCVNGEAKAQCCAKGYYFNNNPMVKDCTKGQITGCEIENDTSCFFHFDEFKCEFGPYINEQDITVKDRYVRIANNVVQSGGLQCPPGTLFDEQQCGCYTRTEGKSTCFLDFNFPLDSRPLINNVSGNAAWFAIFPATANKNNTAEGIFRGDSAITLPTYNRNEFRTWFFSVEFAADGVAFSPDQIRRKMTLFSNCRTTEGAGEKTSATLDISFFNTGLSKGSVEILSRQRADQVPTIIELPAEAEGLYRLSALYDGSTIEAVLTPEVNGQFDPNAAVRRRVTADGFPAASVIAPMIAGCKIESSRPDEEVLTEAFYGIMKNVMVAKCIPKN